MYLCMIFTTMATQTDIIIIGGGAAGLMAATGAAQTLGGG